MIIKKGEKAPPPDLESKPKDVKQYAFAPVCELDHVTGFGKEQINVSDLDILTACRTCGRPARFQTILRTAEAQWEPYFNPYDLQQETETYHWSNKYSFSKEYYWTKAERVRSL